MVLGFKDQFIPYIEEGSKTHSIRAGFRWKVGMRADLYRESRRRKVYELRATNIPPGCICHGDGLYGMRCDAPVHAPAKVEYEQVQVAGMRLIFRAPVVRVQTIEIAIRENTPRVTIDGELLMVDEANAFFWRDGFRDPEPSPRLYGALWRDFPYLSQAMAFWCDRHKLLRKPFRGQIVHWDYAARFMDISETCFRESARRAMEALPVGPMGNGRGDWSVVCRD